MSEMNLIEAINYMKENGNICVSDTGIKYCLYKDNLFYKNDSNSWTESKGKLTSLITRTFTKLSDYAIVYTKLYTSEDKGHCKFKESTFKYKIGTFQPSNNYLFLCEKVGYNYFGKGDLIFKVKK